MKKYFKSKKEAVRIAAERNSIKGYQMVEVNKMPKGTRHHGMYYVGSYLDWLNFAN